MSPEIYIFVDSETGQHLRPRAPARWPPTSLSSNFCYSVGLGLGSTCSPVIPSSMATTLPDHWKSENTCTTVLFHALRYRGSAFGLDTEDTTAYGRYKWSIGERDASFIRHVLSTRTDNSQLCQNWQRLPRDDVIQLVYMQNAHLQTLTNQRRDQWLTKQPRFNTTMTPWFFFIVGGL